MISEETQRLIQENFNDLPEVVQDSILNSNWQDKIRRIVQNHKLHIDQGAALESLVFVTMLGIEDPEDFAASAKEGVRLTDEQAQEISFEVEREIFHDIRQKLIEITESHDTIDEVERVTNELTKVDDDIAQGARNAILEGVTMHSKASRVDLRAAKKEVVKLARVITLAKIPRRVPTQGTPTIAATVAPTSNATPVQKVISLQKNPVVGASKAPVAPTLEEVTPSILKKVEEKLSESKPTPAPTPTIAATKLNTTIATTRESIEMPVPSDVPPTIKKLDRSTYGSTDPYREPVA